LGGEHRTSNFREIEKYSTEKKGTREKYRNTGHPFIEKIFIYIIQWVN